MPSLLTIQDLRVDLDDPGSERKGSILRGIDLDLNEGERLALVGESGCGKSMTALSVLDLLPSPPMKKSGGRIQFLGKDLNALSATDWRDIRGKRIGMIFQEPLTSLNPVVTIGAQVAETLQVHLGLSREQARQRTVELLREVGLSDPERILEQYPHQLSGGMCQRAMIAMAIACSPSLLIADEPTTALDVTVQAQILELLLQMTQKHRLAILFITHNLRIIRSFADKVAILYRGQVVEQGRPDEIFDHPQHPYTEGLLASLPQLSSGSAELFSIPGNVPSPFETIVGCSFAGRCPKAQARCTKEDPLWTVVGKGHGTRCFYPSNR